MRDIKSMEEKYPLPALDLVDELRTKRFYLPQLDLVMVDKNDAPIGCCMFSRFHLEEKFENELLFRVLHMKGAYDSDARTGFIQYGHTAFGFGNRGGICEDMSRPVIRTLYFDKGQNDADQRLLQTAMQECETAKTVYAIFHCFGMSCFARQGKLFEDFPWLQVHSGTEKAAA